MKPETYPIPLRCSCEILRQQAVAMNALLALSKGNRNPSGFFKAWKHAHERIAVLKKIRMDHLSTKESRHE